MEFKDQKEMIDYIAENIKDRPNTAMVNAFSKAIKPAMRRERLKRALAFAMGKRRNA